MVRRSIACGSKPAKWRSSPAGTPIAVQSMTNTDIRPISKRRGPAPLARPRNTIDFGQSRAEAHGHINYWPREFPVLQACERVERVMSQNRVFDDFARLVT